MITRERTPILEGDNLLGAIHTYAGDYGIDLAYHGTSFPIELLQPTMPCWYLGERQYRDSDEPVVCAADGPLIPTFLALAPRTAGGLGYKTDKYGDLNLYIRQAARARVESATGYVAVMGSENFSRVELGTPAGWPAPEGIERQPELRTDQSVIPDYLVKVGYADLCHMVLATSGVAINYI